jgi:predicted small secreted protein
MIKRILVPLSFVLTVLSACNSSETVQKDAKSTAITQKDAEWESLFDGVSSKGWHSYGKDSLGKAWKVEDSALHLDASVKSDWQTKNGGDIVTDKEYENFHLKLDWKISKGGNSGIMFYVKEDTSKYKYPWETGPEMQVVDNVGHPDGKSPLTSAGSLYDLIPVSKNSVKPAGEWNAVEIIADHGKLDLYLNSEHVISTTLWDEAWKKLIAGTKFATMPDFGTLKKGRISLQDHGADVWYRNIKIKRL